MSYMKENEEERGSILLWSYIYGENKIFCLSCSYGPNRLPEKEPYFLIEKAADIYTAVNSTGYNIWNFFIFVVVEYGPFNLATGRKFVQEFKASPHRN